VTTGAEQHRESKPWGRDPGSAAHGRSQDGDL